MTQLISDLVRKVGFNDVDAENDGHSALERLRHKKYGLVLSDWEMQPMSGEEFLKAMRQDRAIGKIPIILITGTAGRGTAWLAGAAAYLPKLSAKVTSTPRLKGYWSLPAPPNRDAI